MTLITPRPLRDSWGAGGEQVGGSHLIRRGLAVRRCPQSTQRNGAAGSTAAATEPHGQKFDLVTGLKRNNSAWMETTSDTFKLKIPEFVQLSFALRFLPIISKSVQILERTQQLCQSGEIPPHGKTQFRNGTSNV